MNRQIRLAIFTVVLLISLSLVWHPSSLHAANIARAQTGGSLYLPLIISPGGPITPPPPPPPSSAPARINLPAFDFWRNAAIAWFGNVNPTDNYADIRIAYREDALLVNIHMFDRRVWYDENPTAATLSNWDAISLYLYDLSSLPSSLDSHAYQFDAQYNWYEDRSSYQASYRGSASGWQPAAIPFTSTPSYQGDVPNNNGDDRGWAVIYEIPYSSLGLSGTPPTGTIWGFALVMHDRDDAGGTPIADKTWPVGLDPNDPSTWNEVHFGLPGYPPVQASNLQTLMIRHKLNGANVPDGHVGGSVNCGDPYNPNFFNGWGDANYAGATQVNVQNQGNLGDWPCFSKYYVTFPLTQLPQGKAIVSAELVMYQFGNSNPNEAQPSLIQVLTVGQDWDEASLTWNNAPLAVENVSQAVVDPLLTYPGEPGVERKWDLSRAVAQAYAAGQPLRLALYSADIPMHSGKYFHSSDVDDFIPEARPALLVTYGDP